MTGINNGYILWRSDLFRLSLEMYLGIYFPSNEHQNDTLVSASHFTTTAHKMFHFSLDTETLQNNELRRG